MIKQIVLVVFVLEIKEQTDINKNIITHIFL